MPLWPMIHAERTALLADLVILDETQWATKSLCGAWTVREVVAHLTAAASIGRVRWLRSVAGARFDFDQHNQRRLVEQLGSDNGETLSRFRSVVSSTTAASGHTPAWLGEVIVHSLDVRAPLGIDTRPVINAATEVARFYASRDFAVPSKTARKGLRLVASDGDFAAGDGPLVSGPTYALIMAMAGRGPFCDELTGEGVATLRSRCGAPTQ